MTTPKSRHVPEPEPESELASELTAVMHDITHLVGRAGDAMVDMDEDLRVEIASLASALGVESQFASVLNNPGKQHNSTLEDAHEGGTQGKGSTRLHPNMLVFRAELERQRLGALQARALL